MKINLELAKVQTQSFSANKTQKAQTQNFAANPQVKTLNYGNNHGISNAKIIDINTFKPKGFHTLSFRGNPEKNRNQIVSIAPEYQGLMDTMYKIGGLGNVAGEAAVAFKKEGGIDFRTFVPYYAPDNKDGDIKVGNPKAEGNGEYENIRSVKLDYELNKTKGERFLVTDGKNKPRLLEETGIKGEIETISPDLEIAKVPYTMFQLEADPYKFPGVYVMHLEGTAKFPKSYNIKEGGGTGAYGSSGFDDLDYGNFDKAVIDALPKMKDNKRFGEEGFNPASFWLHDRQAFSSLVPMEAGVNDKNSYWHGIRAHSTFHNPGRDYQGHYESPLDFLRIMGSKETLDAVKALPDYAFIKEMNDKIQDARAKKVGVDLKDLTKKGVFKQADVDKLHKAFEPVLGKYRDELGEYNLCEIPVQAVKKQGENFSAGTVSTYYGKEMKDQNTTEIAYGLTKDFASIKTIDIVNGSTPASLNLHEVGKLGAGKLSTEKLADGGFVPLPKYDFDAKGTVTNIDAIYEAKQKNKEWLINHIAQATGDSDALKELFYTKEAIAKGAGVIGGLSEFVEGDKLFISWGRPDKQKGFPTTVESFNKYFNDPNVSAEDKKHTKVIIGAGPWPEDSKEWKTIQESLAKIPEEYKNNVIYLNGFFTNRIVMAADYAIITSEYEPCGITPLEAFAAAMPVLSNRTGGSPDFITEYDKDKANATGFLTEHAYKVNPEVVGGKKGATGDELDKIRREALGKENAENIKKAMGLSLDDYKAMSRNAASLKIDWHENGAFNKGKAAMDCYLEDVWGTKRVKVEPKDEKPGIDTKDDDKKADEKKADEKTGISAKAAVGIIGGIVAAGLAIWHFFFRKKDNAEDTGGAKIETKKPPVDKKEAAVYKP